MKNFFNLKLNRSFIGFYLTIFFIILMPVPWVESWWFDQPKIWCPLISFDVGFGCYYFAPKRVFLFLAVWICLLIFYRKNLFKLTKFSGFIFILLCLGSYYINIFYKVIF